MDSRLYNAAILGDMNVLVQDMDRVGVQVTIHNNDTVLHLASLSGKTECVREILSKHPSLLRRVNSIGDTALHLAARNGHSTVVQALVEFARTLEEGLESGVGVAKEMLRMTNDEKDTALHEAVRYHHFDVVELLTQEDTDFPHSVNNDNETPLYIAAERGYDDLVSAILETCTSPTYGGSDGRTALHGAIISNSEGITRKLLERNQSLIKEVDEYGRTPLHYAAFLGKVDRVSQLLSVDKSIAYTGDKCDKNTAHHLAASKGFVWVIKAIMSECPDCWEMVNDRGRNILHIAVEHEQEWLTRRILEGCPTINRLINKKDVDGNTPLHLLVASNILVPELIEHPMADMGAFNKEKLRPSDIVIDNDRCAAVRAIKSVSSKFKSFDGTTLSPTIAVLNSRLRERMRERERERERERSDSLKPLKAIVERVKKAAETHVIVAALIATVTFTAGFTIPGGYNQNESEPNYGMAILSRAAAFQAFMVTDTLALLFSTIAIVIYFGVPTFQGRKLEELAEEYEGEEEEQKGLQKEWLWYIAATYIVVVAIIAMMIAFVTGTYAVLAHSPALAIATCVVSSSTSLILFVIFYKLLDVIGFLRDLLEVVSDFLWGLL